MTTVVLNQLLPNLSFSKTIGSKLLFSLNSQEHIDFIGFAVIGKMVGMIMKPVYNDWGLLVGHYGHYEEDDAWALDDDGNYKGHQCEDEVPGGYSDNGGVRIEEGRVDTLLDATIKPVCVQEIVKVCNSKI